MRKGEIRDGTQSALSKRGYVPYRLCICVVYVYTNTINAALNIGVFKYIL